MSRRKQGLLSDIVDITAKFPWWLGVILAIVSYLLLHHYATRTVAMPASSGLNSGVLGTVFIKGLSSILQYVLPSAFLIGTALSAYARIRSGQMYRTVSGSGTRHVLNAMSWQDFEALVGEYFRSAGFQVTVTGGGGADGGVDIRLTKNAELYLVQCKQWRANRVGVQVVRELYGVMAAEGAAGGFVVTSGDFTSEAMQFAQGRNIQLLDGTVLHGLIRQNSAIERESGQTGGDPRCPVCNSSMVLRTAKRGSHVGQQFWGCQRYPSCKGTINL